jgi:hypothetical protein
MKYSCPASLPLSLSAFVVSLNYSTKVPGNRETLPLSTTIEPSVIFKDTLS